jgi:DNA-binding MarR family transcriptional regulator
LSSPFAADHDPFIGALLRIPHDAILRRIIRAVNQAGFDDVRVPHFPVFAYPGPDGVRPSALTARTGMTKQALNQLLNSLESAGYLRREDAANGSSGRVIRLTERGRALGAEIVKAAAEVEADYRRELGPERLDQLKELLRQVWSSSLVDRPA